MRLYCRKTVGRFYDLMNIMIWHKVCELWSGKELVLPLCSTTTRLHRTLFYNDILLYLGIINMLLLLKIGKEHYWFELIELKLSLSFWHHLAIMLTFDTLFHYLIISSMFLHIDGPSFHLFFLLDLGLFKGLVFVGNQKMLMKCWK